jgi:hypothetical protein
MLALVVAKLNLGNLIIDHLAERKLIDDVEHNQ